jgi:hypothetical protein
MPLLPEPAVAGREPDGSCPSPRRSGADAARDAVLEDLGELGLPRFQLLRRWNDLREGVGWSSEVGQQAPGRFPDGDAVAAGGPADFSIPGMRGWSLGRKRRSGCRRRERRRRRPGLCYFGGCGGAAPGGFRPVDVEDKWDQRGEGYGDGPREVPSEGSIQGTMAGERARRAGARPRRREAARARQRRDMLDSRRGGRASARAHAAAARAQQRR